MDWKKAASIIAVLTAIPGIAVAGYKFQVWSLDRAFVTAEVGKQMDERERHHYWQLAQAEHALTQTVKDLDKSVRQEMQDSHVMSLRNQRSILLIQLREAKKAKAQTAIDETQAQLDDVDAQIRAAH